MLYRGFLKGLVAPLAVCLIACAAFLNLALLVLILCAFFMLGYFGYSVWRLLLARQQGYLRRDADALDRHASFYWLGGLVGSLLALVGYILFGDYALRPMHHHTAPVTITEGERARAACPLQYFVDGLPANFFGTIVHDQNKLFLVVHGCSQRVELTFPDQSRDSTLVTFKSKLEEHLNSPDCGDCWKYEPEVNVTGDLSVQSRPPGFRKDESGRVYSGSGEFVGSFLDQKAAQFTFKLNVIAIEDMGGNPAVSPQS